jgi:ubiquinone/menaquinone biosynthesis C-methylase UbiE
MALIDPADVELETLRALGDFAGRRVIEIGAGDGRLAWPLAAQAALWLAVDNDRAELRAAADDLRDHPLPPLRLLQSDGRALPVAPASFDLAFFTWSLCCVPREGMPRAVAEAGRVLRAGGQLLDIHPTADPMRLEAWLALAPGASRNPPAPGDYRRQPLGSFAASDTLEDFRAALAALAAASGAARPSFSLVRSVTFEYPYFFESLDELTDYLEANEELDQAGDDLLERALQALSAATTPAWLVLVQPVVATSLRKLSP